MKKKLLMEALESIDSKIMTDAVKEQIVEAFELAVEEKAEEKVQSLIESVEKATEEHAQKIVESKIAELKESYEKAIEEKAKIIAESEIEAFKKEKTEELEKELEALQESLDKYATYTVEKFIEENKAKWVDEIELKKAEAILESAANFAVTFGIDLTRITEANGEVNKKLDEAIDEINRLKAEKLELEKKVVLDESTKDLTESQKEKLKSLLEGLKLPTLDAYREKISLLKEAVISDDSKDKKLNESRTSKTKKYSWE